MTNILEATSFGATSTTDDVLSGVNLKGKRMFVTDVSAGIGVETARSLAAHGAQVVGAARDLNKAMAASEQVRKDAGANGGSFELVELDLANLRVRVPAPLQAWSQWWRCGTSDQTISMRPIRISTDTL